MIEGGFGPRSGLIEVLVALFSLARLARESFREMGGEDHSICTKSENRW